MNPNFCRIALNKFTGCDSDELQAGSKSNPSIWLLGLEHGTFNSIHDKNRSSQIVDDQDYSIALQKTWPYNRSAFKLLSAMHTGYGIDKHEQFAEDFQPFVKGSTGFFKGNLYPVPCHAVKDWEEEAQKVSGASTKEEYLDWCRSERLPVIKKWVEEYSPKVIIGVGITNRHEFSSAVFGEEVPLAEEVIAINGHRKRIFHHVQGEKRLVVIPHFSGRYGLNSNASLQQAGEFISSLL